MVAFYRKRTILASVHQDYGLNFLTDFRTITQFCFSGRCFMKIGVAGCAGRMGKMLCDAVVSSGHTLVGGTERAGAACLGENLGEGVITDNPRDLFEKADAVLDFTTPENSVNNAKIAAEFGKILVIGTTGLSDEQVEALKTAAKSARIVYASNMSVGVTLLTALVEKVAETLDSSYDIEIVEMHHRNKADAPSGTAKSLGEAAAKGRGVALSQAARYAREGFTGARPAGEIGFATLRGGDVVGDHTVIFAGDGERIELTHKASSRAVFANGAVRAALWAGKRENGLYSMRDVLNF